MKLQRDLESGDSKMSMDELLLNAYYAGFNQSHYAHVHPERFEMKEITQAGKEWLDKYKSNTPTPADGSGGFNPFDYKSGVMKYIKRANCPVCFTDKELSCVEAISAIENETPEGLAICERVIADALDAVNQMG